MANVRVAVNGFGVIGKRVADAVRKQDDMELLGVVKQHPDYSAKTAALKGCRIFVPDEASRANFAKAGVPCAGVAEDLFKAADVIVDCTPGKVGATYKPIYQKLGKKAIFQGGEKKDVAEVSFTAQCNYDKARGKQFIRVVSCNTTGLSRTLNAVNQAFGIAESFVVLMRRAADPNDIKTGPINAIVPELTVPSHQGPDVQTVLPDLKITTVAFKMNTTLMHVHSVRARLNRPATKEEVLKVFQNTPRVKLISGADGLLSTAQIMDYGRDTASLRGGRDDLMKILVWADSVTVKGDELIFFMAIHNEANVVPENIDAIRAAMDACDAKTSMAKTDKALKIGEGEFPATILVGEKGKEAAASY
ncbi:MAG: type II glyceraldehyde-3-phosphate dehydrogenase [Candidatus ainarchaeum sp.]|nr:type II glyceraldehyde-3-phosphate dehydrogenase [Candidatus ainarchaeum sp.]